MILALWVFQNLGEFLHVGYWASVYACDDVAEAVVVFCRYNICHTLIVITMTTQSGGESR